MHSTVRLLALAALTACSGAPDLGMEAAAPEEPSREQPRTLLPDAILPLRIAYCGDDGTEYTRGMVSFLRSHVGSLRIVPRAGLSAAELREIDVLLIDGELYYPTPSGGLAGHKQIAAPPFEVLCSVPTVLMGGVGGRIGDLLQLKTAWRPG